jgi:hypothetical protein
MHRRRLIILGLMAVSAGTPGCPSKDNVGIGAVTVLGAGVANDPRNKSLRFDVLKFGLEQFCEEMLRSSVPLKMSDDQPVIGRFFADHCTSQVLDDEQRKSFVVQFQGKGYAWLNLSRRVGFTSAGLIEYAPDFQLHQEAMYIYFRPKRIDATSFETLMVESAVAQAAIPVAQIDTNQAGRNVVNAQLERGFTVIRYGSDGATELGMGMIAKGDRPFRPFEVKQSEHLVLADDRTEVHGGQQDYIGGFEITEEDQALYFNVLLDGAPAVDVFVVPKGTADLMIDRYLRTAGATGLTAPPVLEDSVTAGQLWKRYLKLPKGTYYLVIDNSGTVGRVSPPAQAGDDRAAKVDYLVQVGEAP